VTVRRPVVLTVAGSDPSGGAGLQGDLRTLCALGVHPLSVVTLVTVQGTRGVRAVHLLDPALVRAQLEAVLSDVPADAAKTGALGSAAIVREVAAAMEARPGLPLVVDPVACSSSGTPLLDDEGLFALRDRLLPRATLVTPNVAELRRLLDDPAEATDADALLDAARRLRARGARAVLAKGGHLPGAPVDVLIDERGEAHRFPAERVETTCDHGTGCTLSSAIASGLARGKPLLLAVREGRELVLEALRAASPIGEGRSPLDPFAAVARRRT
jgi:hydroxymethylpyrimidine kinase/phosphomethylpyrimidine kinase